jgi:hypothetical protein
MKLIDRVLTALRLHGPHTQAQLEDRFGLGRRGLAGLMSYIKHNHPIRIIGWQRQAVGLKNHLRPIFAYGAGTDAPKPPRVTNAQSCRRWRNISRHTSAAAVDRSGANPAAGAVSQQSPPAP